MTDARIRELAIILAKAIDDTPLFMEDGEQLVSDDYLSEMEDGARAVAAWIDTKIPKVEIDSKRGEPTTCRVTLAGHVLFDGVSRDALLLTSDRRSRDAETTLN